MYLRPCKVILTLKANSHRLNHCSACVTRPIQPLARHLHQCGQDWSDEEHIAFGNCFKLRECKAELPVTSHDPQQRTQAP